MLIKQDESGEETRHPVGSIRYLATSKVAEDTIILCEKGRQREPLASRWYKDGVRGQTLTCSAAHS